MIEFPRKPRAQLLPSAVMAMLIFVFTEVMLFSGFISAFTIMRGSAVLWPPPGQPRLPIEETAFNTALLVASGAVLYFARRRFTSQPQSLRRWLMVTIVLGGSFVLLQGREWAQMLGQGLTLRSSSLGSFFYLIVGMHALHAIVALGILIYAWVRLARSVPRNVLAAAEIFWYFVVGIWPILYWRVYLS
ncbi:MAG TPA: cytochrome c oxidase subunit 3 [Myxococcota bacterium]|nr:cytochrome c oxidase subunit 3 [Myxococcota bacterium]